MGNPPFIGGFPSKPPNNRPRAWMEIVIGGSEPRRLAGNPAKWEKSGKQMVAKPGQTHVIYIMWLTFMKKHKSTDVNC